MFFVRSSIVSAILTIVLAMSSLPCGAQVERTWDASLECPGGKIRFGLKVEKSNDGTLSAWLINGNEEIEVPRVVRDENGTVLLDMHHYDSQIKCELVPPTEFSTEHLVGTWKKRRGANKWVEMNFSAKPSADLVSSNFSPKKEFEGRWKINFSSSEDHAVGIFTIEDRQLLGTFLTTTGDYRFLAGEQYSNNFELSCFDGAHAFLFKAKLQEDGTLAGDFWSSKHWHETWTATRDDKVELPDSFELTKITETNINALIYPNLDGVKTRLDDESFLAPVRIMHIFGSWCPNCHDAGAYLAELKKKYGDKMSIVGVAFELTGEFDRDAEQVRKYLKRHELDHAVLIGGTSSKSKASEVVTVIDQVRSYPTTVFADSSGEIIAVHQGFSGPATGKAYEQLKTKFEAVIEGILKR